MTTNAPDAIPAGMRFQGMVRALSQWESMDPKAVLDGSRAQAEYALIDAKHDIAMLAHHLADRARSPLAAPDGGEVDAYVVWSHEHSAWWRANSCGYARRIEDAGVYSRAEAISISHGVRNGWRPGERPDELPIRVVDLPDFARTALTETEGKADV